MLLDQVDGESSSAAGGKKLNNWRAASPPDPPMVKSYTPLVTRLGTRYYASVFTFLHLPLVMPSPNSRPSVSFRGRYGSKLWPGDELVSGKVQK